MDIETIRYALYSPIWASVFAAIVFLIVRLSFGRGSLNQFLSSVLIGGIICGGIGLIGGAFGSILYGIATGQDSPQGPLLGFIFTGPIGLAFGLLVGTGWWLNKLWRH